MILNSEQRMFLDFLSESEFGKKVYWTGGTALAYTYNHRISSDLDFFSFDFLTDSEILPFIESAKNEFWVKNIKKQVLYNRNIFLFDKNLWNLKIEFTFFPFKNIKKYDILNNKLKIDSIIDIATNKIHAVSERLETKDVFDIYFILKNEKTDLKKLIKLVKRKFWVELNKTDIIARLLYLSQNMSAIKPYIIDDFDTSCIEDYFKNLIV